MDVEMLRPYLAGTPVSRIRAYDEIGSTNTEALAWLRQDAPDFALVIADAQSSGRGRFERRWITQPGASLAFSVIFRPDDAESRHPSALYAPMAGLAVRDALQYYPGVDTQIKWPNDILLERQKCCGILVEAEWSGSQLLGYVLGIGINIRVDALPPEAKPTFPATWLEAHCAAPVDRFVLLAGILNELSVWRAKIGSVEFFNAWQDNLAFKGEIVRIVESEKSSIIGTEEGIDSQGNLILVTPSGKRLPIQVGDVHLRPGDGTN